MNKDKNTINLDGGKYIKNELNLENGNADNVILLNSDNNLNLD